MEERYNYYLTVTWRCLCATKEERDTSLKYWIQVHKKNVDSKRDDMIMFSKGNINSILYAEYLLTDQGALNSFMSEYMEGRKNKKVI